ncbi:MAG: TMEM165/GDT1 family protein [Candidatus Eisenbacteria bacterium]|nr:TMEM165/GDT1 family protein [Candidatus Eisenbacteria bacterium]
MGLRTFAVVFASVLVAELGDKTQLATLMFASNKDSPKLLVFAASAGALVVASAVAVLAGAFVCQHVSPKVLSWVAGVGFVCIGLWTIAQAVSA